jgi:tRNA pseudouridine55 synthase
MTDGLLIIDKPEGWTSHDVVARVRRILKTKRVGHTGTLDPIATGVLVLLVGKATRLAQFLDKDEKEYEAVIQFGYETETGDRTGKPKTDDPTPKPIDIEQLNRVLPEFTGEIKQVPPMYSAKKVQGKKLYELARKGVDVNRKPVKVTISELEVIASDSVQDPISNVGIRVVCSAGTYIRTLATDIGRRIGTGAHLAELRRIRAGSFRIEQSVTVADLEAAIEARRSIIPIDEAVSHLPKFVLRDDRVEPTRNGLPTKIAADTLVGVTSVSMVDPDGVLLAIGAIDLEKSVVQPKVVLR